MSLRTRMCRITIRVRSENLLYNPNNSSILEEKEVIEIPGNKETQYPEKTMTLPSRELTPQLCIFERLFFSLTQDSTLFLSKICCVQMKIVLLILSITKFIAVMFNLHGRIDKFRMSAPLCSVSEGNKNYKCH